MVQKDIFQNISFTKIIRIIIILLFIPNIVKAENIEDYQEVEWIKGTGTQWIDTGWLTKDGMKAEYEVSYNNDIQTINGGYVVGSHNISSPYSRNGGYLNNNGGNKKWELGMGNYTPQISTSINYDQIYKIEFSTLNNNGYLKVDGTTILTETRGSGQTGANTNVMIFTNAITNANNQTKTICKLYYVKIWDKDGNLIRDYIPVYKKSDGTIGLYDKVEDVFAINAGSGVFLKGENITPEPPEPEGNQIYTDFLTLYIDKIEYVANESIENPYLLSMIGIIIGFIVLELGLKIINIRRGKRR